jgi:hypothetical protein
MPIHRQNSYTSRSRRCIGRREAQRRKLVNGKNLPVNSPHLEILRALSFIQLPLAYTNN